MENELRGVRKVLTELRDDIALAPMARRQLFPLIPGLTVYARSLLRLHAQAYCPYRSGICR